MNKRRFALAVLSAGAGSLVMAACEPPPPPPPERIQLNLSLYAEQPVIGLGYDVRWNRHEFQIRSREGYEFCDPRVESVDMPSEPIHEPLAPGDPDYDGVIVDGWVIGRGSAVFSVVNNQACWDEGLWARYGGHPYKVGWDLDVDMQLVEDGPYDNFAEFEEVPRIEYDIVK